MDDSLKIYFKQIEKTPKLSHEQIYDLFESYSKGDKFAKNRIIEGNLKLVIFVAKKYRQCGVPIADLIQEGNIGLIKSIEKYDHKKGFKFSTYSTWWIRQSIGQHLLNKKKTIRLPGHIVDAQKKLFKLKEEYVAEFGCEPTIEELSDLAGESKKMVQKSLFATKSVISLSSPISKNDQNSGGHLETLEDKISDESLYSNPYEVAISKEILKTIEGSFEKLTPRQNKVIQMRFGIIKDEKSIKH
jgi:RNA polymerase primary sigma factor